MGRQGIEPWTLWLKHDARRLPSALESDTMRFRVRSFLLVPRLLTELLTHSIDFTLGRPTTTPGANAENLELISAAPPSSAGDKYLSQDGGHRTHMRVVQHRDVRTGHAAEIDLAAEAFLPAGCRVLQPE